MMVEKFSTTELAALRNELLENSLDSWDAARLVQVFLMGRGYGVSPEAALDAASRMTITTQVRRSVLHRFPFLVTYIARGRGVLIFAVAHAPLATALPAGESRTLAGCGRRTILAFPK